MPVAKTTVSGTSDPRTSTTLILFEEFVPLEYRQQLQVSGTGRRRRLPSLFGTSSRKQWKPAPTLNGRPYVVGHVPHSPSYREVEFEGLLKSNESTTKVISLKIPEKAMKSSTLSPPTSTVTSPILTKPSLLLATALETPLKRVSSRSSENGSIQGRSSTPVQNPNRKSSIFRSPIANRTIGLPPAEYDTVDFEARIANIDGDDPSTSGNRRGKAKDDAWVDILVSGNGRRLDTQAAEFASNSALCGGRSDPEIASQEVSEVLAAVRNQVFSDDEDDGIMEPVSGTLEEFDDGRSGTMDRSEGARSVTPGRSMIGGEEEDEEHQPSAVKPKRLGYFDLHPERRPSRSQIVDDIDSSPQINVQPPADELRGSFESEASKYDESDPVEPEPVRNPIAAPLPSRSLSPADRNTPEPRSISPSSNATRQSAAPSLPKGPAAPVPPAPSPQPSKTASLIEMYRERERSAQTSQPLPPSKLPVRTSASMQPHLGLGVGLADHDRSAAGNAPAPRSRSPSPSAVSVDSIDESLSQPLPQPSTAGHTDAGLINTLNRYVHGAPLHNVLEEEEEEE